MERCFEEISSAVLDAGELISYRTLGIRSETSNSVSIDALDNFLANNDTVKSLQLLIERVAVDSDDNRLKPAAAKHDPRSRIISFALGNQTDRNGLFCKQTYALYNKSYFAEDVAAQVSAIATVCYAQERQVRNKVLSSLVKHEPLSTSAKALYASSIKCKEATTRQCFGDQGEETISAFDGINVPATNGKVSSSSFFKRSEKMGSVEKRGSVRKGGSKTSSQPKVTKLDMSNRVTNKRIISDDEDDEAELPAVKESNTSLPKSRNVKRKLNASPVEAKKALQDEEPDEDVRRKQGVLSKVEDDESEEEPIIATKRQVLVSKTRINEQGYMVTEKSYQEVELTPDEIENERKAAKKKKRKNIAVENAAKAKKEAKQQSGLPRQRDLRSFFSNK
ncbi:DNA polymerase subunit Cdc27 [Plasmopara halstedii]|uniref:DNA polymerase subunit Cdc27 n=1 Tax=Plasmopara halstedii TaxID=4781 RepID=A0A0P1B3L5_PLAHL|nr:DNA polymerase subunit Cdc27 [Plasmopara halstedii]CEG48914.1 DNA polymerase subunit Cdc27 [Plasmopara halstedii]|eukprot:XP_024585283.1 DNA polymerase subunit Cdc27 [Plasmopara halstedii]